MPVWKKKEITKTERTVEYTTIDVEGNLQELYEFEVTETEVNWWINMQICVKVLRFLVEIIHYIIF